MNKCLKKAGSTQQLKCSDYNNQDEYVSLNCEAFNIILVFNLHILLDKSIIFFLTNDTQK